MKKLFALASVLVLLPSLALAQKPSTPPGLQKQMHGVGTNVVSQDGTIWLITSTERRPYTSTTAFSSYGFNSFDSVVQATKGDLSLPVGPGILPRDGSLCISSGGTDASVVYVVSRGQKLSFTTLEVFTSLNYSFASAISCNLSAAPYGGVLDTVGQAHPRGTLINENGTVMYVGANGKYGIPDVATFNSWGFTFSQVLPATAGDSALAFGGIVPTRQVGELNPPIE